MATNTHIALDKVTVTGSVASSVTFSSIPSTYTDLVIVANGTSTVGDDGFYVQVGNGSVDTGYNYSTTYVYGTGSAAASGRESNNNSGMQLGRYGTSNSTSIINITNYSNTTTYKNCISRANNPASIAIGYVGLWRSTAAINTVKLIGTFNVGFTFSLYGIRAEGVSPAPKATGGAIYSDSTYYYHVFGATGTFTPLASLTTDYVVVAGGGGGAGSYGGGGGAGGLRYLTSQTLSATGYTVTVGAGGVGQINYNGTPPTSGTTSSFNSMNTTGGGGGGYFGGDQAATGGSAGGSRRTASTGTGGNAGGYSPVEGYAGGGGFDGTNYGSGGGGGSGQAGTNGTATAGGTGGNGLTSTLITSIVTATGIGQLISSNGYLAGGGGGGTYDGGIFGAGGYGGGGKSGNALSSDATLQNGTPGITNTGSGGGGGCYSNITATNFNGANGGSGVVVIRYSKA